MSKFLQRVSTVSQEMKPADCPHCKQQGTLVPTNKVHEDTNNDTVRTWACRSCHYTEGRTDG